MEYLLKEKDDKRFGIFTDLHVGVASDSKIRLNETQKCVKWIIKKFKEEFVDYVIFCGDLFNSRYSINVNTLNIGIEIIEDLAFNFSKVFLIEGNHDTYYKNTNIVNSIKFLQRVGKNDNVIVIDEKPGFLNINGTTIGLYPWGFTPSMTETVDKFITPDYGFGHFEMRGIEMPGGISEGTYSLSDMFVLGNTLFSGHYHTNKIYKDFSSDNILYMVGSSLQLNWGDYNQKKKIIILDSSNGKINEIENTKNATFNKVFYSELLDKDIDEEKLKKRCYHNFIKFVIDKQYKFENILKFSELIKKFDPYSLELDYLISISNGTINDTADEIIKSGSKTNKDYILEYIDKVFPDYKKIDEGYDLNYLKSLCCSYFDKAQTAEKEEEL